MQTQERAHCARSVFPFTRKKEKKAAEVCASSAKTDLKIHFRVDESHETPFPFRSIFYEMQPLVIENGRSYSVFHPICPFFRFFSMQIIDYGLKYMVIGDIKV